MTNQDLKVLCIDDEKGILALYDAAVREAGFTPILAADPAEAVSLFRREAGALALVICDYKMPGMSGFDVRKALAAEGPAVPFVMVSAFVTREMALAALELKIAAFFDKPLDLAQLHTIIVKHAAERVLLLRESQALESVFVDEALQILEEMEAVLLSLDHDRQNQDALNLVYRGAHTLKGSSGCLESDLISKYVHKYEDIISGLRKGTLALTDAVYDVLLRGLDRVRELVSSVQTRGLGAFDLSTLLLDLALRAPDARPSPPLPAGAPSTPAPRLADAARGTPKSVISVPVSMLDELSSFSGEITVIRNMVNKIVRSLETRLIGNKEVQSLGELLDEMHKINSTIQLRITDLRKVPLTSVLKPIPRIVRDLGRDLGKNLNLVVEGDALRVDNALAAVCSNSLVHLVRNSADHGIETPDARRAAGKPEAGTVTIRCSEDRDEVHILIRDDGRGIDHRVIRAKALEKGLLTATQLEAMSDKQALGIIFASGFSTATAVTDVSGRGVGMDMVRSSVEAVGGHIEIESTPGFGSSFDLRLPIPKSVLIINSLLVTAAGRCFAVPQDAIQRVLRVERAQYRKMVQRAASGEVLRTAEALYPMVGLRTILGIGTPCAADAAEEPAVVEMLIVASDGLQYALRVDGILDSEEIVVKRLQPCFNPAGAFAGATFMGDGTIGLILDVRGLAELAGIRPRAGIGSPRTAAGSVGAVQSYLLFGLGSKAIFGAPLEQVFRLEEIDGASVQACGGERVVIYRDRVMPLYSVERLLGLPRSRGDAAAGWLSVIVAESANGYVGLEVDTVIDIAATDGEVSTEIRDRPGVAGNAFIRDQTVTILDLHTVAAKPHALSA